MSEGQIHCPHRTAKSILKEHSVEVCSDMFSGIGDEVIYSLEHQGRWARDSDISHITIYIVSWKKILVSLTLVSSTQ